MEINAKYHLAIKEINNNFNGSVTGNTEDTIAVQWNGINEISISDIKTKVAEMDTAREAEAQTKIDKKTSGKQKLKDLGLDDDEIQALMGV